MERGTALQCHTQGTDLLHPLLIPMTVSLAGGRSLRKQMLAPCSCIVCRGLPQVKVGSRCCSSAHVVLLAALLRWSARDMRVASGQDL